MNAAKFACNLEDYEKFFRSMKYSICVPASFDHLTMTVVCQYKRQKYCKNQRMDAVKNLKSPAELQTLLVEV